MKNFLCIGLVSVAILFVDVCYLDASAPWKSDYFYLGVSGGYSVLSGKVSPMDVDGSLNLGGHLGYEYRHGLFLLRASANVQSLKSRCSTPISIPDMIIDDQVGTDATMHYEMKSPLEERLTCLLLGVGVMAGYSQNSNNSNNQFNRGGGGGFYILGGLNFTLLPKFYSDVSLDYSTTATYSKYIDDYEDMPNHYYSEQHSEDRVNLVKNNATVLLMISAELGWEFVLGKCDYLKLGAFCDVGVTNIMYDWKNSKATESYYPNHDNISQILVSSYYLNQAMKDKYVIPFMVGLRLGVSINCNIKRNCPSGDCRNCHR